MGGRKAWHSDHFTYLNTCRHCAYEVGELCLCAHEVPNVWFVYLPPKISELSVVHRKWRDNEVTFLSLFVILMRQYLHYYLHEENAKYVGPACIFASLTQKNVLKVTAIIYDAFYALHNTCVWLILKFFNTMKCAQWKMLFGLLMSG